MTGIDHERQEEGIEKGDKEEDIRQTREPINTDDRHEPVTSLDLEMNLVNQSHKDNLRHLPRLPGFFVTFRILSVVTTRMLALVISTIS